MARPETPAAARGRPRRRGPALAPRRNRTLGPATTAFFAANLRHIKGPLMGQPLVVDQWQQDDLDLILEVNERGRPVWREVLWGVARGMGKSPTAGGLCLTDLASYTNRPEIYVGSGAREQANIVGHFAREMAGNGPLARYTKPIVGGVRWDRPGGGVVKVVSADGGLQHGKFPLRIVLDELHVFMTTKQEEVYNAMTSALHKWPASQLLGITTAGYQRQSLLGELYDVMLRAPVVEHDGVLGCRLVCADRDAGRLMIWRGAPPEVDASDPAVWAACTPASWIEMDEIARLAKTQPRAVFERLQLNRWTESSEQVIRAEAWDACRGDLYASPVQDVVVAWSASPRRDQASLVIAWARGGRQVACRIVKDWDGVDQGVIERELPAAVETVVRAYSVARVAADPIQLPDAYEAVRMLGVAEYKGASAKKAGMPQTDAYMEPATSKLASLVEQENIVHDGDQVLRAHVLRCEARNTRRGWRLARPPRVGERSPDSVEAAIALSMAIEAMSSSQVWADAW